jgi:hypothetical protein
MTASARSPAHRSDTLASLRRGTTMKRLTTLAGLAAALTLAAMAPTAQADAVRSTSCVMIRGLLSCTTRWHRVDTQPPQPTEQELAEARERERIWTARCRPEIVQDGFGVPRYTYAAPGCEYGRLN